MKKKPKYEISSQVKWATEVNGVKVYDGTTRQTKTLLYPEAALWDLLSQRYSMDSIALMMTAITRKKHKETEEWISRSLDDWFNKNLLEH